VDKSAESESICVLPKCNILLTKTKKVKPPKVKAFGGPTAGRAGSGTLRAGEQSLPDPVFGIGTTSFHPEMQNPGDQCPRD
jgi:hypothetical protein